MKHKIGAENSFDVFVACIRGKKQNEMQEIQTFV